MSLKYKISLLAIGLISIVAVAVSYVIQLNINQSVEEKIRGQFLQSKEIFEAFKEREIEMMDVVAYGYTFSPNFKSNVSLYQVNKSAKNDIRNAIEEVYLQSNQAFDIMIVLDNDFNVICSNKEFVKENENYENYQIIKDLYESESTILRGLQFEDKLFLAYSAQIEDQNGTLGYAIIGREINNNFADYVFKSTKTDISFFINNTVTGTTLQRQKRLQLEEYLSRLSNDELKQILNHDSSHINLKQVLLNDEEFLIDLAWLDQSSNSFYILALSFTKESLVFADLQNTIIIISSIGIFCGILLSFIFGNSITKPIGKLVWAVQEIEKENYGIQVQNRSKDEIGKLSRTFNEMAIKLGERFELLKFVSKNTFQMIQEKGVGNLKLGGVRKHMVMFFSDIRGFTAFSEKREPEEVIEMLNLFLRKQAEIVHKHGGDIDKFVGDELMAIFEGLDGENRAVACAREIMITMDTLNRDQQNNIHIGIGINAGEVVSGNMGSENRIDHTVLGNHVNLAARLCSKAEAKQIIISKAVAEKLPRQVELKELEPITVKGISQTITIYEVIV